jgi:uncharacterized membrane protein (DUF106 family)
MSDWDTIKTSYQSNRNNLDNQTSDTEITNIVNEMNANISNYTNRAGISQSSNPSSDDPAFLAANNAFKKIMNLEKLYAISNSDLSNNIKTIFASADIDNKLRQVGTLQESIKLLKKEVENAKQDSDTAKTRQSTLEAPQTKLSMYQGFGASLGFVKPLYNTSIPFLLGFGVLFLFLSGLILREFFLPGLHSYTSGVSEGGSSIFAIFSDSRFLAVAAGMAFVITVLLILSLSGYLGKNAR